MKKTIFVLTTIILFSMCNVFAGKNPDNVTTSSDNCLPPAYLYNVTVNISQASDCVALYMCNLEVVLYRYDGTNTPQAIARTPFVYGTDAYLFNVYVDNTTFHTLISKIIDQPGTPCGYPYNQSGYKTYDITYTYGGPVSMPELTPCN